MMLWQTAKGEMLFAAIDGGWIAVWLITALRLGLSPKVQKP
jgi:hypothetical protein